MVVKRPNTVLLGSPARSLMAVSVIASPASLRSCKSSIAFATERMVLPSVMNRPSRSKIVACILKNTAEKVKITII